MEYLILLILSLLGFSYIQFNKRKEAETKAILGNVAGEDKQLSKDQELVADQIKLIDEQIKQHQQSRKENKEAQSLLEREKQANEKFKK